MITSIKPTTTTPTTAPAQALREDVERSASRGRRLSALSVGIMVFAALIGGLFVVAGLDALIPLAQSARLALLLTLLGGAVIFGGVLLIRRMLSKRYTFGAAERIDDVTHHDDQPVVRGMTLMPAGIEDRLTESLRERAERQAADVASSTVPKRVYPLRILGKSAGVFAFAMLLWIMLAIIFPAQFGGLLSRVLLPWGGAPPFSLTQLDPSWTPDTPTEGENVTVSVQPEGVQPKSVDFVRLDEAGNEIERFEMAADEQGGFHHTLAGVTEPIRFHLEANGRPSWDHTITPEPKPAPKPDASSEPGDSNTADNNTQDPGGTTSYDPKAAAELARNAHEGWPELRERIQELMKHLAQAQARAEAMDPADFEAMKKLEGDLDAFMADADQLAGDLRAMQGDLPPDAAATLNALLAALAQMQCQALGACPNPGSGNDGNPSENPSAGQAAQKWLDDVGDSAGADTRSLASGLGHSSAATHSGTTSGRPDGTVPDFIDPTTSGAHDEQGVIADTGPLPPAVMQQVPPSYREHIRAYFNKLAETEEQP